jgi:hypothetical protein
MILFFIVCSGTAYLEEGKQFFFCLKYSFFKKIRSGNLNCICNSNDEKRKQCNKRNEEAYLCIKDSSTFTGNLKTYEDNYEDWR